MSGFSYARSLRGPGAIAALMCTLSGLSQAQTPASVESQYREGLYQRETGRPYSAIETLENVLAANPGLNRARLELAVAYYRTLNFAKAKAEAQQVLNDPTTPEPVRLSVLSFLKQLELDEAAQFGQPHHLDMNLSTGLLYDSNVNAGPDNAVLPGGLVLDPGSEKKSDSGYVVQGGVNHLWLSPTTLQMNESTGRFGWASQASAYYKGYAREHDYNLAVFTLATGPTLFVGRNFRGNLNFQVDGLHLGDKALAVYSTVSPSGTWRLWNGDELTVDTSWTYRNFKRSEDLGRDGHYRTAGISYGGLYFKRLTLEGGGRLFDEAATESRLSNSGYELFVGARQRVAGSFDLFGRAAWRHSGYLGREFVYEEARRENERRIELGAKHQYKSGWLDKWETSATISHVNNQSNLSIYDYDRDVVQITLGRSY